MLRKVLFVIDALRVGGAEKSTLEIARRMTAFTPIVCQLYEDDSRDSVMAENYRSHGIDLIQLKLTKRDSYFSSSRKLKEVIKEVAPQIVHAILFRSEITTRLALWNNRDIVLIGSLVGETYHPDRFRDLSVLAKAKLLGLRWLDVYTARRVNKFISISKFLKDTYSTILGVDPTKIVVIPRGRSTSEYSGESGPGPSDDFEFVNVGRLIKLKGHTEVIKAVKLVLTQFPQIKLKIAGEGPLRDELTSLIKKHALENSVQLLGNVSDIPALLRRCHFFVFASHHEGQGGALVEAMMAGKPIIASDIPVVREAIDENKTGILFAIKSPDSLAAKMIYAIQHYDALKHMGENAKMIARQRYDIDNIVRQHEQLYKDMKS